MSMPLESMKILSFPLKLNMQTTNSLNDSSDLAAISDDNLFKPKWDEELHILFLGHLIVKHYQRPSLSQYKVLAAFEEQGWPARINDPLPSINEMEQGQIRDELRTTVLELNRAQYGQTQIRFRIDETGHGILWTMRAATPSNEKRSQN